MGAKDENIRGKSVAGRGKSKCEEAGAYLVCSRNIKKAFEWRKQRERVMGEVREVSVRGWMGL